MVFVVTGIVCQVAVLNHLFWPHSMLMEISVPHEILVLLIFFIFSFVNSSNREWSLRDYDKVLQLIKILVWWLLLWSESQIGLQAHSSSQRQKNNNKFTYSYPSNSRKLVSWWTLADLLNSLLWFQNISDNFLIDLWTWMKENFEVWTKQQQQQLLINSNRGTFIWLWCHLPHFLT